MSQTIFSAINVIPIPSSVKEGTGHFLFTQKTTIQFSGGDESKKVAQFFVRILHNSIGTDYLVNQQTGKANSILFLLDKSLNLPQEGYKLTVHADKIMVTANTANGLFYGMQTLRQLFPPEIEKTASVFTNWTIPCVEIEDSPRFEYRGMHLDVSRHFFNKSFILKYIDLMSMYKYNRFHWHLTDDQGWRIEIKRFPKLTKIGAFRTDCKNDTIGGYYTQQEIKEVVDYAKERFVEVIPEIEMPGHSMAVLSCYPELSCSGGPFTVPSTWGIFPDVFCAGNDQTFEFIENILDEVTALFPYKYIHIGGDECPKKRWERCVKCQARMVRENLWSEHELQSYFVKRIEGYLNTKGKQIIGWDEILEGGVSNTATIMSWRGTSGGVEAAQHNNHAVMSPVTHCYFDHYQGLEAEEPLAFGKGRNCEIPLQRVYDFEPIPSSLTESQSKYIIGGQANLWSEYLTTQQQVEYMAYPRALALIECLWSDSKNKNYSDFEKRVHTHYLRLDNYGLNYSKSGDKPTTKERYRLLFGK
ncbi:MAG: beta-N-acetylhexosaminidase [Bacteroidales bacterium]